MKPTRKAMLELIARELKASGAHALTFSDGGVRTYYSEQQVMLICQKVINNVLAEIVKGNKS